MQMTQPPFIAVSLPVDALDRMMPLHLRVASDGRITGCGSTLAKLCPGTTLIGQNLFAAFDLRRPAGLSTVAGLAAHAGQKLRLILRSADQPVQFRGVAMPLADRSGLVLNLSFGDGIVDAIRRHALTDTDFAPTDMTVEMMFLVEANRAAMQELANLAERLKDDKKLAETLALTDTLTGLRNRRSLSMTLETLMQNGLSFGLMHIDLDFFKAVNDTFGHAAGDHVLRQVAQVLLQETRAGDTVARVGGDEFVAVFPGQISAATLEGIARRIIAALTNPIAFDGHLCRISASVGITATSHYARPDIDQMQANADEALYASKHAGRGRATVYQAALGATAQPAR